MRIERIVITGDVFRTTDGDPNQLANARWLRGELARPVYELTGLWPDVRYRRNAPDEGRAVIAAWYRLLGHAPSLEAWAATFALTAPPAAVSEALSADYDRALVIGFELSPLMRSVLDDIGAPWVDIGLSPIRFLDDLALDLRFSWPVDATHPGVIGRHHIEQGVERVRARHRADASAAGLGGACVFLAQTRQDRTLIKDGRFFPDEETIARVAAARQGRPLVLKPHPLAPDNPLLSTLHRHFAAPTTEANIYAILAGAREARLLTISSSAAIEAQHFGHAPEVFHAAAHADAEPLSSLWAHRCTAFWRAALAPILPLKADADFEEGPVPDRLRRRIGAWGWVSGAAAPAPLQESTPEGVRAVP
jgi:hypothetical protein